jgi:hypothetical protein
MSRLAYVHAMKAYGKFPQNNSRVTNLIYYVVDINFGSTWETHLQLTVFSPNFTFICLFSHFSTFNTQFLYSLTICILHYNPRHVSSINMPICRRTNCIITASGIATLCKRLYSMPDESRLHVTHILLMNKGIVH